jgi:hypothetical protein
MAAIARSNPSRACGKLESWSPRLWIDEGTPGRVLKHAESREQWSVYSSYKIGLYTTLSSCRPCNVESMFGLDA